MNKLSMFVATAFAFASFGAFAVPKAAENAGEPVVAASASAPQPKAATAKAAKKPAAKKSTGKKPTAKKSARKAM
jgi:hypothetical protein